MAIHETLLEAATLFGEIAAQGPIEAVLVGMGGLLTGSALAFFGYLTLRAGLELVIPESVGRAPSRRG